MEYFKLTNIVPITSSDKIRWVYLIENPLNIEQIAFKGYDDPEEIMSYINMYVDRNKIFNKLLQKKIDMFYDSMSWVFVDTQNTLERFF